MDDDLLAIQRFYPQIFHACHVGHTRSRRSPHRISERDQSLLAHLSLDEGRAASGLARHFGVGLPTLSEAIARLVRQGYVERGTSARDRRALSLKLTPAGAEALVGTSVLDHERLRSAVATLSVRDRKRVVAGLELLARAAQDAHARPSKRGAR